jgi:transposase
MSDENTPLPNDVAACQRLILELAAQLQAFQAAAASAPAAGTAAPADLQGQARDRDAQLAEMAQTILALKQSREELQQQIETLQLTLQKLLQQLYGRRSERFLEDPKQKKLDFGGDPETEETLQGAIDEAEEVIREIKTRRQSKAASKGRSEAFPAHLERVEKIVDLPDAQKTCATHGERKFIGYDTTETLKFKRPELYVEVTKYAKYACPGKSGCGVQQPPRLPGLIAGNRYDTGMAAEIATQKYGFHLPFYRQQDWFAGCGLLLSRSTLLNILTAAADVLKPLSDFMRQVVLTSGVMGCDDTTVTLIVPPVAPAVQVSDPRSQRIHDVLQAAIKNKQPTVTARMWAYRGVDVGLNIFDFTVSRHRDGPDEILANYQGVLIGDCWSGFRQIDLRSDQRIVRAACWAHARRKVFDARLNEPTTCSALLALIRQLYDIEDRGKSLLPAERLALRQREAIPLLNRIRHVLDSPACTVLLPKSKFGEAVGYLRNHWQALLVYTTDGLVPIDNNDVEQLMKQVAIGRKNWLFKGSVAAGNRAAVLLTLISSALRHDLDVWAYLKDALDTLLAGSTDYAALRPDVWKQSHPEHIRVYRQEERQEASDRRSLQRAQRRLPQPDPAKPN